MLTRAVRDDGARPLACASGVLRMAAQLAFLWGVASFAHLAVAAARVPLPGNVVGLGVMFALLQARVVRLAWCEDAAKLLIQQMSLFFIPLAVGALAFGALFARAGIGALSILVVSAALGIVVAGRTVVSVRSRS